METRSVEAAIGERRLAGDLVVPVRAVGVVAFAHGSGSSRHSPRNQEVAARLRAAGLATLLFDLLTPEEEQLDLRTSDLRFDIDLLARRLLEAIDWVAGREEVAGLPLGCFGASTGAAAAIVAAAERPDAVRAIVSRGGRPDLADAALDVVQAPTLLIVGGADDIVLRLNRRAMTRLASEASLEIVAGATHLFEEPGALQRVSELARDWFLAHLGEAAS